jgi:nitrite reductase/ring-hydroxylating ferredoxin subunit
MAAPQPTQKILLGDPAEILPGRSKSYRAAGKDIIVVNVGDGLRGYVNFCTHMGGKVRCIGERFECDWHGSQFDCRTGAVVDGVGGAPLGSDLEKIEMVVEGDKLYWMYTPKKSPWAME